MDQITTIAQTSILIAGITMAVGSIGSTMGEAMAAMRALAAMAQQPDQAGSITRTLFVSLAMIETIAIYCFVISIILIFANPFWTYATAAK